MRNTAQTFFLIILALAQALVASADAHQFHSDSERHTTSAPLEQLAVQVNLAVAEPNVKTTDQHIQCEYHTKHKIATPIPTQTASTAATATPISTHLCSPLFSPFKPLSQAGQHTAHPKIISCPAIAAHLSAPLSLKSHYLIPYSAQNRLHITLDKNFGL